MYAVIQTGGKQYRVAEGNKLMVEKIFVEEGESFQFDKVLMVAKGENIVLGKPFIEQATVNAKVIRHGRGEKIRIVKMRRRKNSRRITGHRQSFTEVEIIGISG
jgi:large subunit ribosomal protein L21